MANNTPLIEITGFPAFIRQVQSLKKDSERLSETRKILRKVAQSTVKAAKSEVPVSKRAHVARGKRITPGNLRRSIGTIAGRSKENAVVYVGPRAKRSFDGWYGHMVEYGHNTYRPGFKRKRSSGEKARLHNLSGATGRTKGNPFMARAYAATNGQVTAEAAGSVAKYIQKRIEALRLR